MDTKTIFNYDPRNGLFTGTSVPDRNPMYEAALAEALQIRARAEAGEEADLDRAELLETEPEFHYPAFCTEAPLPAVIPPGYGAYFQGDHATRMGSWEVLPLPAEEGRDPAPERTQEDIEAERGAAACDLLQRAMDAMAAGMGFHDLRDAVSFADEPASPKRQAQGLALRGWRSRVLDWFDGADVQALAAAGDFREATLKSMPPVYEIAEHEAELT